MQPTRPGRPSRSRRALVTIVNPASTQSPDRPDPAAGTARLRCDLSLTAGHLDRPQRSTTAGGWGPSAAAGPRVGLPARRRPWRRLRRDPTITTLRAAARRLIAAKTPPQVAVEELAQISRDPKVLGMAAGPRSDAGPFQLFYSQGQVSDLLLRASADGDVMASAAETPRRLRICLRR